MIKKYTYAYILCEMKFWAKISQPIVKLLALYFLFIIFIFAVINIQHAGVAKLVDAPDLGSGAFGRVGSSPITRTIFIILFDLKH